MNSANYINWMDSINFGGEETSFSASYQLQDTMGEIGTGIISSANYAGLIGFRQVESDPKITFSISPNVVDLLSLSLVAVSEGSHTVTTTTNAANGYITTIVEDGNLRTASGDDIDDVTDGAVTAGSEEYGIRTSGAAGQMNSADTAIISTSQTVASYNSFINGSAVIITYRAAITPFSAAGQYNHTVTLISTGRF